MFAHRRRFFFCVLEIVTAIIPSKEINVLKIFQVLFKKSQKINITFSKQERETNIYMILDIKIPYTRSSLASISNFQKTKILITSALEEFFYLEPEIHG